MRKNNTRWGWVLGISLFLWLILIVVAIIVWNIGVGAFEAIVTAVFQGVGYG